MSISSLWFFVKREAPSQSLPLLLVSVTPTDLLTLTVHTSLSLCTTGGMPILFLNNAAVFRLVNPVGSMCLGESLFPSITAFALRIEVRYQTALA